jgi:hypothetical protein
LYIPRKKPYHIKPFPIAVPSYIGLAGCSLIFYSAGLLTMPPTLSNPGGPVFSVGVISPSWLVPILERQELALLLLHDLVLRRGHGEDTHASD